MSDHETWLHQLSVGDRRQAQRIVTALRELGCDDPQAWGRSEMSENIPQLARYRFLHTVWPHMIDGWRDGISNIPAAQRAIDAGASPVDIGQLARAVAYETVFALLVHLADNESAVGLPSWALSEIDPAGHPTGRHLDALHEDLLALDPSGHDGKTSGHESPTPQGTHGDLSQPSSHSWPDP